MTTLPRWISTGNAASPPNNYIVEPTEAKKDVGFDAGEKLPAQFVNWYLSDLEKWLRQYVHTRVLHLPACAATSTDMSKLQAGGHSWASLSAGQQVFFALPLAVGERITQVRLFCKGGSVTDLTAAVRQTDGTSGGNDTAGVASTVGSGDQVLDLALFEDTPDTVTSALWFHVTATAGATATGQAIYGLEVTYDRPGA